MSETKHTPLPWRQGSPDDRCVEHRMSHPGPPECKYTFQGWMEGEYFSRYVSSEATKETVIGSDEDDAILSSEDAKFIVTSVNARPKVEELLQNILSVEPYQTLQPRDGRWQIVIDIAREVEVALGGER